MWMIYKITNKLNKKYYIGQTKTSINKRWSKHIYTAFNERSRDYECYFYRAIRKYGKENWIFEILENNIQTIELANEIEIKYISNYNSNDKKIGYNSTSGGSNYEHSAETKLKIGAANRGKIISKEHKEKISAFHTGNKYNLGRIQTDISKLKNRQSHIGKKQSEETKKKISNANSNKKHSDASSQYLGVSFRKDRGKWSAKIYFNKKRIFIGNFNTEKEAAEAYNLKAVELFAEKVVLNVIQG